jgi:hypothetical protein
MDWHGDSRQLFGRLDNVRDAMEEALGNYVWARLRGENVGKSSTEPAEVSSSLLAPVTPLDIPNQLPRFYPQRLGEPSPGPWPRPALAQLEVRDGSPRNPGDLGELHLRKRCPLPQLPQACRPKHLHPPVSDISDNYKAITILIQDKCATLKAF